jgi:hypothetical protein
MKRSPRTQPSLFPPATDQIVITSEVRPQVITVLAELLLEVADAQSKRKEDGDDDQNHV